MSCRPLIASNLICRFIIFASNQFRSSSSSSSKKNQTKHSTASSATSSSYRYTWITYAICVCVCVNCEWSNIVLYRCILQRFICIWWNKSFRLIKCIIVTSYRWEHSKRIVFESVFVRFIVKSFCVFLLVPSISLGMSKESPRSNSTSQNWRKSDINRYCSQINLHFWSMLCGFWTLSNQFNTLLMISCFSYCLRAQTQTLTHSRTHTCSLSTSNSNTSIGNSAATAATLNALNSLSQFGSLSSLSSPQSMQAALNALAASNVASSSAASNSSSSKSKDYMPSGILRWA